MKEENECTSTIKNSYFRYEGINADGGISFVACISEALVL